VIFRTCLYISAGDIPFDEDRPLTRLERGIVQVLSSSLTFLMSRSEGSLLDILYDNKCITRIHHISVKQRSDVTDQCTELADILKRRSFAQYKQFLESVRAVSSTVVTHETESGGKLLHTINIIIFINDDVCLICL